MRLSINKLIAITLLSLSALTVGTAAPTCAGIPYPSYTYNIWGEAVPAPQAYVPLRVLDLNSVGAGTLKDPQDIVVGSDRTIYVLDTGNSRVLCLTEDGGLVRVISEFDNSGSADRFRNPRGLFVTDEGEIYVADTGNARLVVLDTDGNLLRIYGPPSPKTEGILPANFQYRPIKVVVNPLDQIYVVSLDAYDGLLEFDQKGSFQGFVGAPKVTPSVAEIFWRRLFTKEQREQSALILPVEYVTLDIDHEGFMMAATASEIKRLNPGGSDVLIRNGFFDPIGDFLVSSVSREQGIVTLTAGGTTWVDIAAREVGIYSALSSHGRVFTYDAHGNLLYTFGTTGDSIGAFRDPVAIDSLGNDILILDRRSSKLTLFGSTEYQRAIHAAIEFYEMGEYDLSAEAWETVLRFNVNYDQAYSGIGRSLLRQARYVEAMENFRLGHNREDYSYAYSKYRADTITNHFSVIMTVFVLLVIATWLAKRYRGGTLIRRWLVDPLRTSAPAQRAALWLRRGEGRTARAAREVLAWVSQTYACVTYALYVIFHPMDGFWDLKHEKRGNASGATVILALVVATYMCLRQYSGFLFTYHDVSRLNLGVEIMSVLVPFGLWVVVNWALTTLTDGKGTLKDVYVTTAYALTPVILLCLPATVLSNYMTLQEGTYYHIMVVGSLIWSVTLLFFGMMNVHEYSGVKTLLTGAVTVVGIGTFLFIALTLFSVCGEMAGLLSGIYREITFRL